MQADKTPIRQIPNLIRFNKMEIARSNYNIRCDYEDDEKYHLCITSFYKVKPKGHLVHLGQANYAQYKYAYGSATGQWLN